jgi:hypothetical protein
MRRALVILGCCALSLGAAAAANGAGGPVPPMQNGAGVSTPGGSVNYVALSAGGHRTVIERVRRGDGFVERTRVLRGDYGIPGAAYDGSSTGLSFDESTLVLGDLASRPQSTRLLVLDARRLKPRARIALPGWFTVDAVSPDGRWMYLIHYRSANDANHYEVRAYDLRARRLVTKPVIDPREPDEKMQGLPITRTTSPDGRWAYTLYQRPSEAPFIHALDTQNRTAACIDLDDLNGDEITEARLVLAGGRLRVDGPSGPRALVDTRTFAVRSPTAATPRPPAPPPAAADDSGVPWELALLALVPLAGLAVLVARRRRRAAVTR